MDTYQCEWKTTVENPELRKRFTHFLNTPEPDPTLVWSEEREQKFPANWRPRPAARVEPPAAQAQEAQEPQEVAR